MSIVPCPLFFGAKNRLISADPDEVTDNSEGSIPADVEFLRSCCDFQVAIKPFFLVEKFGSKFAALQGGSTEPKARSSPGIPEACVGRPLFLLRNRRMISPWSSSCDTEVH